MRPLFCTLLFLAALTPLLLAGPDVKDAVTPESRDNLRRLAELKEDINLLNLLNGIHLTSAQMALILEIHGEAEALRSTGAADLGDTVAALEALKERLESRGENETPEAEVSKRAAALNHRAKERHDDHQKQLNVLGEKVASILSDAQLEVLQTYKPCLIPPRDLRNPVRVGQADEGGRAHKMLQRLREVPDGRYGKQKQQMIDRMLDHASQKHGKLDAEKESSERARLADLLDSVRAMDDLEFELEAAVLAEAFKPYQVRLNDELSTIRKSLHPEKTKIVAFFLSPRMVPLLETRMALLKAHPEMEPTDLDAIDPAPNCLDGKCGVK